MYTKKGVIIIAGAFAFAALSSWAGPGSVISSFKAIETGDIAFGAYRDNDYVYVIHMTPLFHYAMKCTPTGSFVGLYSYFPGARYVPEDPDHSFLGSSYITLAAEAGVVTYRKAGGAPVRWDHVELKETIGYAHRPGSPYYFVGVASGSHDFDYVVYRFNTGGSLVSSFVSDYGLKLAAAGAFRRVPGEYLITYGGATCGVYDPGGSLVATFDSEAGSLYGGTVGLGYPSTHGPTLWALWMRPPHDFVVYQIDLGNGKIPAVAPASLGRVKALFR